MHIVERSDIAQIWKRILSTFIARPPADRGRFTLYVTSGTSGGGPIISVRHIDRMPSDAERLLTCFGSLCIRLKYLASLAFDDAPRIRRILLLDTADLDDAQRLAEFSPDGLLGSASMILHAAKNMSDAVRADVGSVILGGERVRDDTRNALERNFPHARIRAMYNATELGNVSKQWCDNLPPHQYHPARGIEVSIHEPDNDGVGDLLVSTILFGAERVENYCTGDLGRLIQDKCPCTEPITFEVVGRRGIDYVKIPGAIIRREEWDRVAQKLKQYDDYRVEVKNYIYGGRAKAKVVLRIVHKRGAGSRALGEEIARKVSRSVFVTPKRSYAELVALGVLDPLVVEFQSAPFPQKIKDARIFEK